MHADMNGTGRDRQGGFWDNLATGLKVVGSELRWIVLGRVRAFEIRQLGRRLEREFETLGRLAEPVLAAHDAKTIKTLSSDAGVNLCLKQIEFLREEIAQLEDARLNSRRGLAHQRAEDLGMQPRPDSEQDQ